MFTFLNVYCFVIGLSALIFLNYHFSTVFLCLFILLCAVFLNFIFQPFYWVLTFSNIHWTIEKAKDLKTKQNKTKQNLYLCFIDYTKAFDCVDHNKIWKTLKEMGIPDHLTCLLRNLYEGQEATVRTLYGTTDWFKIEKGVWQGCLLSSSLFNLYDEHIMRNTKMNESQAGIKTDRRKKSATSDMRMIPLKSQKVKRN